MKLYLRTLQVCYLVIESDERLCRTYDPLAKKVCVVKMNDFKTCCSDQLPSVSSLLDGISRQSETYKMNNVDGSAEEGKHQDFAVNMSKFAVTSN